MSYPSRLIAVALLAIVAGCASVPVNNAARRSIARQHQPGESWCEPLAGHPFKRLVSIKRCYSLSMDQTLWLESVTTCDKDGCHTDKTRKQLLTLEGGYA